MAIKASGVALTRISCSAQGSLKRLRDIDLKGRERRAPHQPDHETGDQERGDEGENRRKRAPDRGNRGAGRQLKPHATASRDVLRGAEHFEPHRFLCPFRNGLQRAQLSLMDDRHAIGDFEEFVQILADDDNRAAGRREVDQRLADQPRRARIDAPGRLVDDEKAGLRIISRPMTNFCRFPPDNFARLWVGLRHPHVETLHDGAGRTDGPRERG